MGKGKNRHKARTGDKALYKSRGTDRDGRGTQSSAGRGDEEDIDRMHDTVDRFHQKRASLAEDFVSMNEKDDSDQDYHEPEGVMDLGVVGSDEDYSSDEESSSDDHKQEKKVPNDLSESESSSSSSDDDSLGFRGRKAIDEDEDDDVRNWGTTKESYYHGDTADLEIGQEVDDAYVEEEAAREVMNARYKNMSEADFMLPGDSESDGESPKSRIMVEDKTAKVPNTGRNISNLSRAQKRKLVSQQHPELLPIVEHFASIVADCVDRTEVAAEALSTTSDDPESNMSNAEVRDLSSVFLIALLHA
jgi:U3 small nucleolar RNA-associated protein 3